MRWLFGTLLVLHGLIHTMGFAKAFGLAELSQLTREISRPLGVLWLLAALLTLAAAVSFFAWPRAFWIVAILACVVSQIVIMPSWIDAKFGTLANVLLLVAGVLGFASQGPLSFRHEYSSEVQKRLSTAQGIPLVGDADLAPLPRLVQGYLRSAGVVGKPQVRSMRLRFTGRIRSGPDAPWMPFVAEQHSFFESMTRLFWMRASRAGIPFDVLHRFADQAATMRVRIASLLPMVDAHGTDMTRAETVTLFNDMVAMAPATLISPSIRWKEIDAKTVRAEFRHGSNTITADLLFDDAGTLVDFVSEDRLASSADGKSFTRMRWSTPLTEVRWLGPDQGGSGGTVRIAAHAEAIWHAATGPYAYGVFDILTVEYNGDSLWAVMD